MSAESHDRAIEARRLSFLEKQNEALLRTLTGLAKKNQDTVLLLCIEQQKQILSLTQKLAVLADRDRHLERRIDQLTTTVKVHVEQHLSS